VSQTVAFEVAVADKRFTLGIPSQTSNGEENTDVGYLLLEWQ
jgi:hypothetical protein